MNIRTKPKQCREKEQLQTTDSVTAILRRVGVHSDAGRRQERIGDDTQLSDKLRGRKAMVRRLRKGIFKRVGVHSDGGQGKNVLVTILN
jgi:hypothetical protein